MITLRDFKMSDVGRLVDILNQPSVTQFLSTKFPALIQKKMPHGGFKRGAKKVL